MSETFKEYFENTWATTGTFDDFDTSIEESVWNHQQDKIDSLKAENKKLREGLEFVIKESGTSTSYNKLARQILSEIDTNNKNLNEFED